MKTVLIIEDNREIRENTSELLELSGFRVLSVENGVDGISMATAANPDIILCDIMMPGINGYEVLKNLKASPATADIPFVFVTASGEKREVELAMNMGAKGYVRKPYDLKDLIKAIAQCFLGG